MAFKSRIGILTKNAGITPAGAFMLTPADIGGHGYFLVLRATCVDPNGVYRLIECTTDSYAIALGAQSSWTEAVNSHASLVHFASDIDDTALLQSAVTYSFSRLTGIAGVVTNATLTIMVFD